jgi:hypothetical protein
MDGCSRRGDVRKLGKGWADLPRGAGLGLLLAAGLALVPAGCTRRFYRNAADREVASVLAEKDQYKDWRIEQYHVYPDPRARFADPTNPDRPPMPPDDPAAHDLSPNPQIPGHAGVGRIEGAGYLKLLAEWDTQNRAEAEEAAKQKAEEEKAAAGPVEQTPVPPRELPKPGPGEPPPIPPQEKPPGEAKDNAQDQAESTAPSGAASTTALSTKPKPGEPRPYLIKLDQAVELGLINSREYQDFREDLFLTALPVTLERFAFAPQLFLAEQAIRQWAGSQTPGGPQNNWSFATNAGVGKLFSTGALLLFNFANQTVVNLTGSGPHTISQSTINLDLVQPLLRGGGRAVTLEPLTQSERNLLYEIRNYARFRKTFYVAIAGGGGGALTGATFQPTGVIAPTGFSPTAGVAFSPLTPGVPPAARVTGNPGLLVTPGTAGTVALATAFAAPVSGYLATLLQAAQMRVDEYNISKLDAFLQLARALQEGGDISQLQTDQFEQAVLRGRTNLLMDQVQYLQSLDQFKLQLGLPTNLKIELEDTPFRPLNEQFQRYEDLYKQFVAASQTEPLRFGTPEQVGRVRAELRRIFTSSALVRGTRFATQIVTSWGAWEKLSADQLQARLKDYREERRQLLGKQADLQAMGQNLNEADVRRLEEVESELDLGTFEDTLRNYEAQPWKKVADPQLQRRQQQALYRYVVNDFDNVIIRARNERIVKLRGMWPELARLCVGGVDLLKSDLDEAETAVVQAGLTNRLDLMNVRAQVVDAWRQIAIFANALLGVFNVEYRLSSTTPAGLAEPFAFSGSRTTHQLIFDADLPIVRLRERNAYRASLINYQRARRILQRAEDQVMFDTRSEIRQLRQQEENYRIQQRQVELGYATVESSLDTFQQPAAPLVAGQPPPDNSARAASLTNQLIMAQQNLYNAQFAMTTIWITYLNTRLDLYRDMELMPLDYRGVWIDDVATCECPDGRDRNGGACPGKSAGERCTPGGPEGTRPERLPNPGPGPGVKVQGPWLDDRN